MLLQAVLLGSACTSLMPEHLEHTLSSCVALTWLTTAAPAAAAVQASVTLSRASSNCPSWYTICRGHHRKVLLTRLATNVVDMSHTVQIPRHQALTVPFRLLPPSCALDSVGNCRCDSAGVT